jgi:hypothetical protein
MTAPTTTRSAYPTSIDALVPHARDLAANLGTLPSRNKLMKTFRVGAAKANALLDALDTAPPPATPDPDHRQPEPASGDHTAKLAPPTAATPDSEASAVAPQASTVTDPDTETSATTAPEAARRPVVWPVLILCLPAFVAIWAGWVEMGRLTGFGEVALLPGILDSLVLDTAITLPIGVETYAAYALWVWLSGRVTGDARRFAKWSAIGSLTIGGLGQIAYHLMAAAGWTSAPWLITALVACIPVAVLGMGAALAHLTHR